MLETVITWIVEQVEAWGYFGIFSLMFLESTFVPFPSEVAMIPAGYLAQQGKMSAGGAILAGLLGSIGGAFFNYYFARKLGLPFLQRYGRYFFVPEAKLDRAMNAFRKHGEITTFVCRLIPVVRQLISVPAGVAGMHKTRFGLYTGLGAGIWVAVLTGFGWFVGSTVSNVQGNPEGNLGKIWAQIREQWNAHEYKIYAAVFIPLLLIVVVYVFRQRRRAAQQPAAVDEPEKSLDTSL